MTEDERLKAEANGEKIRNKAKRRRLKLALLKNRMMMYLDKFTGPVLIEYTADLEYDDNTSQVGLGVAYVIGLAVFTMLLNRICPIFGPIANGLIWWYGEGLLALMLLGFWILSRMWVFAVARPPPVKGLVTPWKDIEAEKRGHLVWGWLDPVLLNILLVLVIAFVTTKYDTSLGGITAIGLLIIMTKAVPGVGGNSTMGMVVFVMLAMITLLVTPPVFAIVVEYMKDKTMVPPAANIGVLGSTRTVLDGVTTPDTLLNTLQLDPTNYLDVLRSMIGNVVMFWMIIDDWCGPGALLDTVTQIKSRRELNLNTSASIDSGLTWAAVLIQIVLELISRNVLSLALKALSVFIAYFLWERYGRPTWAGRGEAATFIEGRPSCEVVLGEGPRGRRILVIRMALMLGIACFLCTHFTHIGCGVSMLLFMCVGTEKFVGIALGCVTFNLGLLGSSVMNRKPFTGTLDATMREAYVAGVGANNQ